MAVLLSVDIANDVIGAVDGFVNGFGRDGCAADGGDVVRARLGNGEGAALALVLGKVCGLCGFASDTGGLGVGDDADAADGAVGVIAHHDAHGTAEALALDLDTVADFAVFGDGVDGIVVGFFKGGGSEIVLLGGIEDTCKGAVDLCLKVSLVGVDGQRVNKGHDARHAGADEEQDAADTGGGEDIAFLICRCHFAPSFLAFLDLPKTRGRVKRSMYHTRAFMTRMEKDTPSG